MTLEQLQQGIALQAEIERVNAEISEIEVNLDEAKGNKVKVRIRGMEIGVPKGVFKNELQKRKTELESELLDLQTQFDTV